MKRLQGWASSQLHGWRLYLVATCSFAAAFLLGTQATRAAYALGSTLAVGEQGDALVDAVSSSGPAAGAVVILAFVIKAWLADMKTGQTDLKGEIEKLAKFIGDLRDGDSRLREEFVVLKADQKDIVRRIQRLERKFGSGSTPKADESSG